MKNINELDVASILKNLAGDTARNVLTSIPGVGTAVGIGASVKNYSELNDDLERYKELKASIVNDGDIQSDTLEQLLDVQDELEVDFIDLLQSIVGITSIPGLGFITQGLGPLLVKLSIEEILEKISSIIPIDKDAEKSMIPYLAAIKDIEDLKIKADELEPLSKDAFMDQMLERNNLEEGRKKTGTKLCARGKAAAKAKFDVYPSAYANGYAVQVCQGRIKGLDGKKRSSGAYS
jgi:hypothetical protein